MSGGIVSIQTTNDSDSKAHLASIWATLFPNQHKHIRVLALKNANAISKAFLAFHS